MAIFRKIHVQFWSDVFIQSLTPEQKFFFLYLLTNERTKQCGVYEISTRHISYDTGYNVETINRLINFFSDAGKVLFSRETNEIAIKNWDKYNGSRSPDVQSLVNKEIKLVKNKKLIDWVQSVDRVVGLSKSSLRQEGEEEREQEPEREGEEVGSEKVRKIANEVWKDQGWRETMCMALSLSMEELKMWLSNFNASVSADSILNFDKSKYKKFSRGWIVKRKEKGETVEVGVKRESNAAPLTKLKPS